MTNSAVDDDQWKMDQREPFIIWKIIRLKWWGNSLSNAQGFLTTLNSGVTADGVILLREPYVVHKIILG